MNPTTALTVFTRRQAQAVLDMEGARSAHLVDAVLLGINAFNEQMSAQFEAAAALRVLFSQVEAGRVQFALFVADKRVELCAYSYDPEVDIGPRLMTTDARGEELDGCSLTRRLHPLMDAALARMEAQVWARVTGP